MRHALRLRRTAYRLVRAADPEAAPANSGDSVGGMLNQFLNTELLLAAMYQVFAGGLQGLHASEFREFYEEQLPSDDVGLLMDHMAAKGYAVNLDPPQVEFVTDVSAALQYDHDAHDQTVLPLLDRIRKACGDSSEHADTLMLIEDMMAEETTHRDRLARFLWGKNKIAETAREARLDYAEQKRC